jgi:hypothetical protein
LLSLVFLLAAACSFWSPKEEQREDLLRRDLRSFHWALVGQDTYKALAYVPADRKKDWDKFLTCLLGELRLVDFVAETVAFKRDSNEATVRVRWAGHAMNSLVVREFLWREKWVFEPDRQRWFLQPAGGPIEGLPKNCRIPSLEQSEAGTTQ